MSGSGDTVTASPRAACVYSIPQPDTLHREDGLGDTCYYSKIDTPRSDTSLLAENSPVELAVEEVSGCTLAEATGAYKAHRRGEAANEMYSSGTLNGRARRRYATLLNTDRRLRQAYDNPTLAMLTFIGNPVYAGEWITPVEHTEAITEAVGNALSLLRYHLRDYNSEYAAVRGATKQGVSHWHIVVWVDGHVTSETFAPIVKSYVSNCDIAEAEVHPLDEAVKVDTAPSSELNPIGKLDVEYGEVSPLARYAATQIPHISPDSELSEAEARQGAIEWATPSRGFRSSSGVEVTAPTETATPEKTTAVVEEEDEFGDTCRYAKMGTSTYRSRRLGTRLQASTTVDTKDDSTPCISGPVGENDPPLINGRREG